MHLLQLLIEEVDTSPRTRILRRRTARRSDRMFRMSARAKNIPEGFHSITPYLMVKDTRTFIKFCQTVFSAVEVMCDVGEDGHVRHAQIRIGDSHMMISDETTTFTAMRGVESMGGSPVSFFVYVDDADQVMATALTAGATLTYPLGDQPYGRSGSFTDPFGCLWHVTTHSESK